jgi:capsular exopolysaccharide synthesis family protein
MVTSALGQEGKTTVASQLAVSLARSGRRTLLIDGDVRNPQQHVVLGMAMQRGLCEVLRSEATLDEVVKATPAEGLWALCAGYRDANTDQALASPVLGRLFQELRSRFDLIVVDTGPVLTNPDAMLIGQHVDAAVISVRRDVSRLPKVNEACGRLQAVGVHVVGAVLNGAGIDVRAGELRVADQSSRAAEPQLEQAAAHA